jgi:hypothetical protein
MRRLSCVALFGLALVAPASAHADEPESWRPPALEANDACDVYTGKASGNDPTMFVELRVCTDAKGVTGQAQYSGKSSGWSKREFTGAWSGRVLEARESAVVDQKPNPGWRFCTIDRYALTLDPETKELSGTYDSAACRDHARVTLTLTARGPKHSERPETPLPAPAPPPAPEVARRRACSCRSAGDHDTAYPVVLGGLLLITARLVRRSRW